MTKLFKRASITLAATMLYASVAYSADEKNPPIKPTAETVTRVYDVRSILQTVRDYPASAAMEGPVPAAVFEDFSRANAAAGFGMVPSPDKPAAPDMRTDLMTLIREAVDPESWRENGGAYGSIRIVRDAMIVTQTSENHQAVGNILSQLGETQQRAVRVRATWVTIGPDTESFIHRDAEKKEGRPQDKSAVFPAVDLQGLAKASLDSVRYDGEIVCLNGQTVHIEAGTGKSVVTALSPVVGQSSVGYDARVQYVRSGATLQVTPTIDPSGDVVLDLRSSVVELDPSTGTAMIDLAKVTPTTQGVLTGGGTSIMEKLGAASQSFATTVRLPVGRPVLVGGMTMTKGEKGGGQLYLVIQVNTGD